MKNEKNDLGGHESHGGRDDLKPAASDQLSHAVRRWFRFLDLGRGVRELANAALLSLTIANQLRAMRRKRRWTRREAARRIGIHWLTLARYEWALANMTLSVLKRMAEAYDVALLCRFEAWSASVVRAVEEGYSPRDVLRWRRGVRVPRSVEAPLTWEEEHGSES